MEHLAANLCPVQGSVLVAMVSVVVKDRLVCLVINLKKPPPHFCVKMIK